MKREVILKHDFVDFIPDKLEDGVLYVSMKYATVVHRCCCGCGREVVTPLSPTDWQLTFDGDTISLDPSIGNWNFPCQSHYWIRHDRATWAPRWSRKEIEAGRAHDRSAKEKYFNATTTSVHRDATVSAGKPGAGKAEKGVLRKLKKWLS